MGDLVGGEWLWPARGCGWGKWQGCDQPDRTEPSLEPTASFLEGEWPTRPASTVQIHGDMLVWERGRGKLALGRWFGWGRELVRVWGRLLGLRGEGRAGRVRFLLICSRLIVLYGDGGGNVSLKRGRDIPPCY